MAKKAAVLAVDPVNGAGLFQYLEAFYENGIEFQIFSVSDTVQIKTNSGISLTANEPIAALKGKEDRFDAVVFACGDAMPKFAENASASYNLDLISVVKAFGEKGKMVVGHCVGGLVFDLAGIAKGKKLAVHPFLQDALKEAVATDGAFEVDGNFFTAQTEHTLGNLLPKVVEALK